MIFFRCEVKAYKSDYNIFQNLFYDLANIKGL